MFPTKVFAHLTLKDCNSIVFLIVTITHFKEKEVELSE